MQIKSQLESVEPFQIVKSKAFFSKKALLLRDQIHEYVHGFPAAKNHLQVLEKYRGNSPEKKPDLNSDQKTKINLPETDEYFPVDKVRLKKAIKAALIKKDNDPSKVDLQNILREQKNV